MYYYSIVPQAKLPRNIEGVFTYSAIRAFKKGDIVVVPFRQKKVLGVVVNEITHSDKFRAGIKSTSSFYKMRIK